MVTFILSPVSNAKGQYYHSERVGQNLPQNADANGAYNIARKGLLMLRRLLQDHEKPTYINNQDWFEYTQNEKIVQGQFAKLK